MTHETDITRSPLSSTTGPPRGEKTDTSSPPVASAGRGVPAGIDLLLATIRRQAAAAFTGSIHVRGGASGRIVLRDGLIIDAATSAAPGPESLLLRSGRVREAQWAAVLAAAAPAGRLAEALIERGLLGSAGVQVLTRTATMDGLFALATAQGAEISAGGPLGGRPLAESVFVEPAGAGFLAPALPVSPGIEVAWAVRETMRQLANAGRWRDGLGLMPHSRPRLATRPPARAVAPGLAALLAHANGRRTCRDLAFAVGRGLYPVMAELAQLIGEGWIIVPPPQERPRAAEMAADINEKTALRPYGDRAHSSQDTPETKIPEKRRYQVKVDSPLPRRTAHPATPKPTTPPR
ncbi:hypothetical protein [Frankia sp. AgKG'84/4]|uniref:hypothetical protein n=1 Tax=Frankia sp. AgKG'84/4 TaxID=573490 RepID=UPI00200F8DE6|nr:hypothetical protein [Frankia sp. AgKG'84/4]MCL9795882.1 hypothetical protein [Frankia sp. AgKG'84/4]